MWLQSDTGVSSPGDMEMSHQFYDRHYKAAEMICDIMSACLNDMYSFIHYYVTVENSSPMKKRIATEFSRKPRMTTKTKTKLLLEGFWIYLWSVFQAW